MVWLQEKNPTTYLNSEMDGAVSSKFGTILFTHFHLEKQKY